MNSFALVQINNDTARKLHTGNISDLLRKAKKYSKQKQPTGTALELVHNFTGTSAPVHQLHPIM